MAENNAFNYNSHRFSEFQEPFKFATLGIVQDGTSFQFRVLSRLRTSSTKIRMHAARGSTFSSTQAIYSEMSNCKNRDKKAFQLTVKKNF